MEELGAGELMINCIHRDGKMSGYDHDLILEISSNIGIPTIGCGGAGRYSDLAESFSKYFSFSSSSR